MSNEITGRVMDALMKSGDFLQIHYHVDGKCEKAYAFRDQSGAYNHVIADDNGEVIELVPIPNLVAWSREIIENHAFKCSHERMERGHAVHQG